MRDLNYQLKQLCRRNRDGSYGTQRERERTLTLMADQLRKLGYRRLRAESLKPKHVEALVRHWQAQAIAVGTIKNRLATLRWWAEKVDRRPVVARDNAAYGIPDRHYVGGASKAKSVTAAELDRVRDDHVRLSLELQQAFGLRREEAIKFRPDYADRGDTLVLKPTWTKGGRAREIPVRTDAQRALLNRVHRFVGKGSLIPADRNYRQQLRIYERHTANAGLSKLHGLRHAYAQQRYQELTGWPAPAAGGPSRNDLAPPERAADHGARLTVSLELGHDRVGVVSVYLGV